MIIHTVHYSHTAMIKTLCFCFVKKFSMVGRIAFSFAFACGYQRPGFKEVQKLASRSRRAWNSASTVYKVYISNGYLARTVNTLFK